MPHEDGVLCDNCELLKGGSRKQLSQRASSSILHWSYILCGLSGNQQISFIPFLECITEWSLIYNETSQ